MSQEDYDELLAGAVDLATDMLTKESEFEPFALAMQASDGEIFGVEPEDPEAEPADDDEDVVAMLFAGLRDDAEGGRWRAIAVVADVTLEDDDTDEPITAAIHIAMEHVGGDPVVCIVPYEIDGETVELGDLLAEPGEPIVFAERVKN